MGDMRLIGYSDVSEERFILEREEIHIWRVCLLASISNIESYESILSSEELERSNRFYSSDDRRRFVVSHGALRCLLSYYLNRDPAQIIFHKNRYGKPYLDDRSLFFNLSHSRDVALVAVGFDSEVGVDVEALRKDIEVVDLVRRFFARSEYLEICDLPQVDRIRGFYRLWTGKESVVKARGCGLSIPLDSFVVSSRSVESQIVHLRFREEAISSWTLAPVEVSDHYVASVAYEGESFHIKESEFRHGLLR